MRSRIGHLLRGAGLVVLGGVLTVLLGITAYLNSRPALDLWHTVHLQEEFTAASEIDSFAAYLALEDRLFRELETEVYDRVPEAAKSAFQRFSKGSKVDPTSAPQNWNRSFEMPVPAASVGVLLLHGLSDSPYSLRELGDDFHAAGAHVVGLRVPGHGTAPSGLASTTFEDMAAAVKLAAVHLQDTVGVDQIFVVGYSNGGALAVHYATKAVQDTALPKPAGLILLSPEIGISSAAAYAAPLAWVGRTLGIHKLAWASVGPEFDPYKYTSFALRADVTAWHATQAVKTQLQALEDSGDIGAMPPILAFQSAADATVQAPVLISELFDALRGEGHHLVLFDANQVYGAQGLLTGVLDVDAVLKGAPTAYAVSVITNETPTSFAAVLKERPANGQDVQTRALGLNWPEDVYSLAHIALPFSPDNPLYGAEGEDALTAQKLRFGGLPVYGERSTSKIPPASLIRQHWNPFYAVMSEMSVQFVKP